MKTQRPVLKCGIRMKTLVFRHWETSCENVKHTQWNKVDPSQIFNVRHLEKVFANIPRKLRRLEEDEIKHVEVNGMIW